MINLDNANKYFLWWCNEYFGSERTSVVQALTQPEFAIDSTDPHFNRIKNPKKLITDITERRKRLRDDDAPQQSKAEAVASVKQRGKSELSALVGNLKRKVQGSSGGNKKNWG